MITNLCISRMWLQTLLWRSGLLVLSSMVNRRCMMLSKAGVSLMSSNQSSLKSFLMHSRSTAPSKLARFPDLRSSLYVTSVECSSTTMCVSLKDLLFSLLWVPPDFLLILEESGVPRSRSCLPNSNFLDLTTTQNSTFIYYTQLSQVSVKSFVNSG